MSTTNSGESWSVSTVPDLPIDDITLEAITFNGSTGFIISSQSDDPLSRVFKTTNSGTSWSTLSSSEVQGSMIMNTISYPTPTNIFIFGANDYSITGASVITSSNGGTIWSDISANLPASGTSITSSVFLDENVGWATMNAFESNQNINGYILRTNNGGMSWNKYTTPVTGIGSGIFDICLV